MEAERSRRRVSFLQRHGPVMSRIENERSREDGSPDKPDEKSAAEVILFRPASTKRPHLRATLESDAPDDDDNDPGPSAA